MTTKVAFLGPEGTYTHQVCSAREVAIRILSTNSEFQAVLQQFGTDNVEISPQQSIGDCFQAISSHSVDFAVIPFENSTNGQVVFTYDLLRDWFLNEEQQCKFRIVGEQFVSIHHNLLSNGKLQEINTIYSHPQVWTQVGGYLSTLPKSITRIDVGSTSKAAELVSQDKTNKSAAISSLMSSKLYNLPILKANIEDNVNNTTRFLILGYNEPPATDTNDQEVQKVTSVMFTLPNDDPGALCDVLVQFKENGINLTSISSRPANLKPWQYVFFVETLGKINADVLKKIQRLCRDIEILGEFNRNWRFNQHQ
ncbi:PHA2 [Candida theae]|uniref:prephenate dehydratase n=1 Tax=Candida theae TaxID=1198502 RepID=A0AAD5BEV9_9ASCO|nr:PHA2 [Candida theae]KAI5958359.1 PHA2 [Candida theae]